MFVLVIPAQAGIPGSLWRLAIDETPSFAGVTD